MKKLLFLLFGLVSLESFTQSFIPNTPTLDLKSYILIEPNTNTVIASFNEDAPIAVSYTHLTLPTIYSV